jgi:hypothetical protein
MAGARDGMIHGRGGRRGKGGKKATTLDDMLESLDPEIALAAVMLVAVESRKQGTNTEHGTRNTTEQR